MTTQVSITSGQLKQVKRLTEDAVDRATTEGALDKDMLQRLIGNGDALQTRIVAAILELSRSDQFANEEVESSYVYPGSHKPTGVTEQVRILKQAFPQLADATYDETIPKKTLPANAELWAAIPRWEKVAETYGEGVDTIIAALSQTRRVYNYREGRTGPKHHRQTEKAIAFWKKLGEEQKGHDILIVAIQFGLRHRGRSVRRAREVMAGNEVGLGAFAVGCLILTHPEREKVWEQLHVDCGGDEISPGADGRFTYAPYFDFSGGELEFSSDWVSYPFRQFGSASAFSPQ